MVVSMDMEADDRTERGLSQKTVLFFLTHPPSPSLKQ
jgi:hypothetical protein